MKKELTALTLIPIIALAITGIAQTHWQKTLTITATITTAKAEAKITYYKICAIPPCKLTDHSLSTDSQTLNIQLQNVTKYCIIGVAMIIKNTGTTPIWINENTYTITNQNGNHIEENFTLKQWFTKPFNEEPPIKDDPPETDTDYNDCQWLQKPPIQLDPNQKILTLIYIHCNQTPKTSQHQTVQITLTLNYKTWTNNP